MHPGMRQGMWECCELWPLAERLLLTASLAGLGLSRRPPAAAGIGIKNCVLPQYLVTLTAMVHRCSR
jgi:hypothetical protein